MDKTTIIDVAIVGGGVSGLYAAQLLKGRNKQSIVLEAHEQVGGRVRTLPAGKFAPVDIDLGAHFIHGSKNNILVEIGKQQGWNIANLGGWPDYWSVPSPAGSSSGILLDNNDEKYPLMRKIREHLLLLDAFNKETALTAAGGLTPPSKRNKDMTVGDWLRTLKTPEWAIRLADASIANDYGTCIEKVGLNAAAWENHNWCHGCDYLAFKDAPFTKIVDYLKQGLNIKTSWEVKKIDYSQPDYVLIQGKNRQTDKLEEIRAKSVIVSTSIPILRKGDVKFVPDLPANKQQALNRLGFGNAIKILLKFNKRFWPADCYDVVCGEDKAFCPEYWFEEFQDKITKKKVYMVTGFAAGGHADDIAKYDEKEIIRQSLQHLDRLFKINTSLKTTTPATDTFAGGMVYNWGEDPYIQGGYSYPAHNPSGCNIEDIRTVARPMQGRIFFCGEATNEKLNPTVNGAMETAERAVKEMSALRSARL